MPIYLNFGVHGRYIPEEGTAGSSLAVLSTSPNFVAGSKERVVDSGGGTV
jgi:hypothetical protein